MVNNGTLMGSPLPSWVTGKYGEALSFDGTTDYVSITFASPVNTNLGLFVSAWVYPTSNSGLREIFYSNTAAIYFRLENLHLVLYVAEAGGGFIYTGSVAVLPINTWTYIAFTYDGTTFKLYINTVNDGTTSGVPASSSMSTATVGAQVGASEYFMGVIDEVRVYNRALSAVEVLAAYNNLAPRNGLVAEWLFDAGIGGTVAYDTSFAESKIDGYAIAIQDGSFAIDNAFIGVDWDSWSANAYARKHASYGNARGWTFTCLEDANAIAWIDSVAYHLLTHVADGAAVAFEYTNGVKYNVPASQTVYVLNVDVWYSEGMKARFFAVTVEGA